MRDKYKLLIKITGALIIINVLISFLTDLWKETNYPDYINSILVLFLFSSPLKFILKRKNKWKSTKAR
jgi:hypothetical protein